MAQRLDYDELVPGGMKALGGVYGYLLHGSLPKTLLDLVYLRVSQINGCAYCVNMHARDLREAGISAETLALVPVWREAEGFFSEEQRAALGWAETVTRVADTGVPEPDFLAARSVMGERQLADLTIAIGLINAYNRMAISFRKAPAPPAIPG